MGKDTVLQLKDKPDTGVGPRAIDTWQPEAHAIKIMKVSELRQHLMSWNLLTGVYKDADAAADQVVVIDLADGASDTSVEFFEVSMIVNYRNVSATDVRFIIWGAHEPTLFGKCCVPEKQTGNGLTYEDVQELAIRQGTDVYCFSFRVRERFIKIQAMETGAPGGSIPKMTIAAVSPA